MGRIKLKNMKTGNAMPSWAKGTIAVVGTLAAVFVGYKIYKAINDAKLNKGNKAENKSADQELNKLNSNPATKATLNKAQLDMMANQLFTAMDGYGTDFDTITKVFSQLKNNADFLGLSSAYGIREISSGALNPEPNYKGTLSGALASELGSNITTAGWLVPMYGAYQITAADNQPTVINKILAKNKITYKI